MTGRVPAVFVSSVHTGFESLRADIARLIEHDLGYRALLFEDPSFPIEPDADTVENCRRRVEQDADVFVLILGDRYGSIAPKGTLSVTNIEYLAAKAKGIPVYAFLFKSVVALAEGSDRGQTDNPDQRQLQEFARRVRTADSVWTFAIENGQDVLPILRSQLAYRMTQGLDALIRMRGGGSQFSGLSGTALRIAVEQPTAWQALLLAEVACECADQMRDQLMAYRATVVLGQGIAIPDREVAAWMHARCEDGKRYAAAVSRLLNESMNRAVSATDTQSVVSCGRLLGVALRDSVEWAQTVRRTHVPDEWTDVRDALSLFLDNLISRLESFGPDLRKAIEDVLATPTDSPVTTIKFDLVMTLANQDVSCAGFRGHHP